jgi:hypothetical protein
MPVACASGVGWSATVKACGHRTARVYVERRLPPADGAIAGRFLQH